MTDKPVDDTTNAAADAIEEAIRKSAVGIVTGSGPHLWQGIGTGTLVRWHGQTMTLTADHVLGDTRLEDVRFFLPNDAPRVTLDRPTLQRLPGLPTAALRPFSTLELGRVDRDEGLDLAALCVGEAIEQEHPARFFDLSDDCTAPCEAQTTVAIGFPYDVSRMLNDNSRVVFTQVDWWPIEPGRADLPGFDSSVHFLTGYSPPRTYPDANPHGFSGAARWCRKGPTPGVWYPNLDIIGVTVSYYPKVALLKMVNRKALIGFLRSHEAA